MESHNKPDNATVVKLSFKEHVRQLVKKRPHDMTVEELAFQADVSPSWINTFISGKIKNPGVNQMVVLYDLLSPEPLSF